MARRQARLATLRHPERFRLVVHAFVEGGTELDYLQKIARGRNVRIMEERTSSSPVALLGSAMKWCVDNARILRASGCVDEVWVLFDEDEKIGEVDAVGRLWQQCAEECMRTCRVRDRKRCDFDDVLGKINVGFSKPCIELWALMCVAETPERTQFAGNRHALQSQLAKMMPGYDHNRHPYFDVFKMSSWRKACELASQWEQTFGKFPACIAATRYVGIAPLVRRIMNEERV